mmetsp:Transcript_21629/g.59436  ORF Transcript_21629/g.59436 Transcript_21629/m.59436 type:complete len:114 (+) Transcript_21629:31-372(+)
MRLVLALVLAGLLTVSGAPSTAEEETVDVGPHSEEELQEAREEFDSIDLDSDGSITLDEIKAMQDVPEEDEIAEFFETYDLNNDGAVTFEEIIEADSHLREAAEEGETVGEAE